MARIRSIHPSLFTDEAFMTLTIEQPLAPVLLMGLWTEADDEGVFEWKPLTLKARVLPAVACDVEPILRALVENRFVMQFVVDGKTYGAIRNFMRYQRPKKPNSIHPKTEQVRAYVGSGSEQVGNQFGTGGEKSSQMEDGGGKREKKETAPAVSAHEPVGDDPKVRLKRRITEAYRRLSNDPNRPSIDTGQIDVWAAQGFNLGIVEAVIMDKLEAQLRAGKQVRSLRYFEDSIREAHEARAPAKVIEAAEPDWRALVRRWKEKGSWPSPLGPAPGYGGCKAPHEVLAEFGYGDAA